MTRDRNVFEFARHVIGAALADFAENAQLNQQEFDVSKLATGPLIAAAEQLLVALTEFGIPSKRIARIDRHVRAAITSANGRIQVQSLRGMLEDPAFFTPIDDGWQSVHERFLRRTEDYEKKLGKLHRRLVGERLQQQIETPLGDPRLENEGAGGLITLAQTTLNNALKRMVSASQLDDPSLTLIHDFGDSLNDLHHKLELYREAFDRADDWRRVNSQLDGLRIPTENVDRFALLKARCTKWLEKERQPDDSRILRELTHVCRTQYQRAFGELANLLDSPRLAQFHASCSDAVGRLAEST